MQEPASADGLSRDALRAALLDYSRSPGKYQVGLRQPQVVFGAVREVLQLAVGRDGEGSIGSREATSVRDAARFFVRTAMLFPGADHYALLGVERSADTTELKDRYRSMMRLLHPDFASPGNGAWPADSAVRVNRAYDTLSSAVQRRLYDESLAPGAATGTSAAPEPRRPRAPVVRADADARQSRFKILAALCALAGTGLVALILSATSSPESVQLVQRAPAQRAITNSAREEAPLSAASPVARLQEALAQFRAAPAVDEPLLRPTASPPVKRAEPPRSNVADNPARHTPDLRSAKVSPPAVNASVASADARSDIMLAASPSLALALPLPVPTPQPPPAPPVVSAAPVQPVPPPPVRQALRPGPTLIDAQPLLSQLLQVMESGRGDRILNMLDAEARSKPSAQALSRQYDSIVDGARPVRVSHVEFKAEPGDGRLLVIGHLRVLAGEQTIGSLGKRMVLRAEFASREGNVVITGLSGGPAN